MVLSMTVKNYSHVYPSCYHWAEVNIQSVGPPKAHRREGSGQVVAAWPAVTFEEGPSAVSNLVTP